ncbi:MAG: hypothetical protein NZ108_09840, partial [Bacteroidia bacterium]|nr:hypothetical protein [Bacteroidia bacterium]
QQFPQPETSKPEVTTPPDTHIFTIREEPPVEPKTPSSIQTPKVTKKEEPIQKKDSQLSLEERINRIRSRDYDYHDPAKLENLEKVPAYLRNQIKVDEIDDIETTRLSKKSVDTDINGSYQIKDNTFLFDNPD